MARFHTLYNAVVPVGPIEQGPALPPGSTARIHQHLDIGQGEVDFNQLFSLLKEIGFDGQLTACVFAWEDRAQESNRFMLEKINQLWDAR